MRALFGGLLFVIASVLTACDSAATPTPTSPASSSPPPTSVVLSATPATPRAPQINVSTSVVHPGSNLTVRGTGFDPGTAVSIRFDDGSGPSFAGPPVGRAQTSGSGEFSADVVIPPYPPGSVVRVITWPQKTEVALPPLGSARPASCSDFFRLPTVIHDYPPVVTARSDSASRSEPIQIFAGGLRPGDPMTVRARPILSGREFETVFRPMNNSEGSGRAQNDGTIVAGLDIPTHPDWIGRCLWLELDFGAAASRTWAFVDYRR